MKQCFLIDDEPIFNLISSKVISRSGWNGEVRVFISAKSAFEEITKLIIGGVDLPDLIFLDIRMPDMDGFAFLEELKTLPEEPVNKIAIYMLTSSLDQRDIVRSRFFPNVKGFLSKPLDALTVKDIFHHL